jgi:hypothetical protein
VVEDVWGHATARPPDPREHVPETALPIGSRFGCGGQVLVLPGVADVAMAISSIGPRPSLR